MREGDPRQSKRPKPTAAKTPPQASAATRPGAKPVAQKPAAMSKLGTQKLPVTRMPAVLRTATPSTPATPDPAGTPLISRTATLDDPLTTSLLAEVARRSQTIDVSPEQIAEARDIEPGDRDPDDST